LRVVNLDINEQWLELMDNETMSNESTLEEYLARKELLARRLNANSMPITTAKLKRCILKCWPWQFKPHETSLSASTATCDIPQTLAAIRVVAQNIGFNDQVPRAPRAAVVRKPNPAGGLASIECYHCGELGHVKRHCPKWEGNALPKKGNVPASEEKKARAGMASAHLQSAGEGQWIVDTGATNHICNDLRLMSNVMVYDEAKPLGLAASDGQAMRKAQGNVCLSVDCGESILLTHVEYVPTATDNLLSVSAAIKDGCTFSVNDRGEYVAIRSKSDEFECGIESKGRLYFLSHSNGLCAWGGAAAMLCKKWADENAARRHSGPAASTSAPGTPSACKTSESSAVGNVAVNAVPCPLHKESGGSVEARVALNIFEHTGMMGQSEEWLIDSGASVHIVKD
jgi:hypothetical protein